MANSRVLHFDADVRDTAAPKTLSQVVIVPETPCGVISLPTNVYDLIAPGLPRRPRLSDVDSRPRFSSQPPGAAAIC